MRREGNQDLAEIFATSKFDSGLEAVVLMKATGILVASWTRSAVPQEVLGVMAATMWGSLDTMVRTLGGSAPRSVMVEVDDRRIVARKVPPSWMLLLVAPRSMARSRMSRATERIVARFPPAQRDAAPRGVTTGTQE